MAGWRHARLPGKGAGNGASFTYREILATPFAITLPMLKEGFNIFGVNVAGPVAITVPTSIPSSRVIAIKDESGIAASNPITVTVI